MKAALGSVSFGDDQVKMAHVYSRREKYLWTAGLELNVTRG